MQKANAQEIRHKSECFESLCFGRYGKMSVFSPLSTRFHSEVRKQNEQNARESVPPQPASDELPFPGTSHLTHECS